MKKHVFLKKWRLLIAIFLIFLIAIACALYFLKIKNQTKKDQAKTSAEALFIPNFGDIREVVVRGSEKWVAAEVAIRITDNKVDFYSQRNGLVANNTIGVINHNGQIWFSSQGGASRFLDNENRFKSYLVGESNVKLIEDPYEKKLFASTFKHFYSYEDDSDKWIEIKGPNIPINVSRLGFSPTNIFGSSFPDSLPVVVYSRAEKKWTKSDIPEFGSQQNLPIFSTGERVFIYGRSKNYTSCGDQGKEPGSIFFEFKDGAWSKVSELDRIFFNLEPSVDPKNINGDIVTFIAQNTCDDPNIISKFTIDFANNDIKLLDQTETPKTDDDKYADISKEISKISGLLPNHEILSYEDNVLLTKASDGLSSSFTKITIDQSGYSEKLLLSGENLGSITHMKIIPCSQDKLKYLFAAYVSDYDGDTSNSQLYRVSGEDIQKINIPETNGNLLNSFCIKDKLYWSSEAGIVSADVIDNKIVTDKIFSSANTFIELIDTFDNKIWFTDAVQKGKIFNIDPTSKTVESFSVPELSDYGDSILAITSKHFWLKSGSDENTKILKIDRDGNIVLTVLSDGSVYGFAELSEDHYLVSTDKSTIKLFGQGESLVGQIDYSILPHYDSPTTFMGLHSNFHFFVSGSNILFADTHGSGAGSFILPIDSF